MHQVRVEEAVDIFPSLLEEVINGEEIIITQGEEPIAKLLSIHRTERKINSGSEMAKILEKTWILVNTASREGLPMSFLEAAGYSCAIVSGVDPDNFSGRFGLNAINDNYEKAIADIMSDKNVAKEKGRAAREYVLTEYEWNIALDRHIQIYINQLENKTNLFNEQD